MRLVQEWDFEKVLFSFTKINNSYKGTTDELYFLSEYIDDSPVCGVPFNVNVYCSDNTTLCYSEITYFSENEELVTVVDSDCDKTCSSDKNFWITNKDMKLKRGVYVKL